MLFNQITLQNERFHIAGGNNIFKINNIGDKPLGFTIVAACKIRADAVLQHFGLAYINNGALFILHQVAPGQIRQQRQLVADIIAIIHNFSPTCHLHIHEASPGQRDCLLQ
ncbi:hypothetical protein D3C81_1944060 [compost metagenome]